MLTQESELAQAILNRCLAGENEIYEFCRTGDTKKLKETIKKERSIKEKDLSAYIRTTALDALHVACAMNQMDAVKYLIKTVAMNQVKDDFGYYPIHYAMIADRNRIAQDSIALVNYLIEEGADIDARGPFGLTPLGIASALGRLALVKLLCQTYQANVDGISSVNHFHQTPLHRAVLNNHKDIVCFLLDQDANSHLLDRNRYSPLVIAILNNNSEIIQAFWARGCWLNPQERKFLEDYCALEDRDENTHQENMKMKIKEYLQVGEDFSQYLETSEDTGCILIEPTQNQSFHLIDIHSDNARLFTLQYVLPMWVERLNIKRQMALQELKITLAEKILNSNSFDAEIANEIDSQYKNFLEISEESIETKSCFHVEKTGKFSRVLDYFQNPNSAAVVENTPEVFENILEVLEEDMPQNWRKLQTEEPMAIKKFIVWFSEHEPFQQLLQEKNVILDQPMYWRCQDGVVYSFEDEQASQLKLKLNLYKKILTLESIDQGKFEELMALYQQRLKEIFDEFFLENQKFLESLQDTYGNEIPGIFFQERQLELDREVFFQKISEELKIFSEWHINRKPNIILDDLEENKEKLRIGAQHSTKLFAVASMFSNYYNLCIPIEEILRRSEQLKTIISDNKFYTIYEMCALGQVEALGKFLVAELKEKRSKGFKEVFLSDIEEYLRCIRSLCPNALHVACSTGQLDMIKFLIEEIRLPHGPDLDGFYPIHYAVLNKRSNKEEILSYLSAQAACMEAVSKLGLNALDIAVIHNDRISLEFFFQEKSDIEDSVDNISDLLYFAVIHNRFMMAHILLLQGANPWAQCLDKPHNFLVESIFIGSLSVTEVFFQNGYWLRLADRKYMQQILQSLEEKQRAAVDPHSFAENSQINRISGCLELDGDLVLCSYVKENATQADNGSLANQLSSLYALSETFVGVTTRLTTVAASSTVGQYFQASIQAGANTMNSYLPQYLSTRFSSLALSATSRLTAGIPVSEADNATRLQSEGRSVTV